MPAALAPHPTEPTPPAAMHALRLGQAGDVATGLLNQHQFLAAVYQEAEWVARAGQASLLLMVHIAHLDSALKTLSLRETQVLMQRLGDSLRQVVRHEDTVGRLDDQVFGLLLHGCPPDVGAHVAQRLTAAVNTLPVATPLTACVGGAFTPVAMHLDVSLWMQRVLAQLRAAQSAGGRHICWDANAPSWPH